MDGQFTLIGKQVCAVLLCATWTVLWTYLLMKLIKRLFRELTDEEILQGLDITNHGTTAYEYEAPSVRTSAIFAGRTGRGSTSSREKRKTPMHNLAVKGVDFSTMETHTHTHTLSLSLSICSLWDHRRLNCVRQRQQAIWRKSSS